MNSKNGSNKVGLKAATSKLDNDLEKLKKENAVLKKKLEESSKSKLSGAERTRLLEKILDLETQNVKNGNNRARQGDIIENFSDSLNARNTRQVVPLEMEAGRLEEISTEIRKRLPEVSPCKGQLESSRSANVQNPPKTQEMNSVGILEAQLKDALEKNKQWLVYDQQRETYVQGLMAHIGDLQQQVANAKQTQPAKESNSDAKEDKQKYYDRLLLAAKKDLEGERQLSARLNSELSALRMKYEEKKKDLEGERQISAQLNSELSALRMKYEEKKKDLEGERQISAQLNSEISALRTKYEEKKKKGLEDVFASLKSLRESEKGQREDERRRFKEKMQRLKDELDFYREKYEEEKNKNWDLSNQIQKCTSDLENGKIDQQNVQQQLNKVLKELRKTREQITKLEPGKCDVYFVDSSYSLASDFNGKLNLQEEQQSPKLSLLDESFLECPSCRVVYPTSQHRELLAHIDLCTS